MIFFLMAKYFVDTFSELILELFIYIYIYRVFYCKVLKYNEMMVFL